MRLFAGLGNPGAKYARNRHNIGFMAAERIAADHGFGPWRSKFQGSVAEGVLGNERVILLMPETFMNLSGQSVAAALRFHKILPDDLTVFHDEIDLAPGKLKVKQGGGHAGHNGLRSIHQHVGPDYGRVRMGVGHPGHKDAVPGYVLRDFPKADDEWLDDMLRGVSDGTPMLAAGDTAGFANAVGLRLSPQRPNAAAARTSAPEPAAKGPAPDDIGADNPAGAAASEPGAVDTRSAMQRLADRFR